jgi:WD40 repeat protein
LKLFDISGRRELGSYDRPGGIWSLAFTANDKVLALSTGLFGDITLCRADNGKVQSLIRGHTGVTNSLVFAADETTLVSASGDGTVKGWHMPTPSDPLILQVQDPITGQPESTASVSDVAFSPDGRMLGVSGKVNRVSTMDVATQQWKGSLWTNGKMAFAPDGKTIVSSGLGFFTSPVRVLDAGSLEYQRGLEGRPGYSPSALAISPDGKILAGMSKGDLVIVWDFSRGKVITTWQTNSNGTPCLAFSPSGKLLATCADENQVKLWDTSSWKEIAILRGHAFPVSALAFAPDNHTLASASIDVLEGKPGEVKFWDVALAKERTTLRGHSAGVTSMSFSPDGKTLATSGNDRTIRLWNVTTGQSLAILRGSQLPVVGVAFSPEGTMLAGATETGTIFVWHAATRKEVDEHHDK